MTELPKWIRVSQDGRISYYPNKVVGNGSPRRQLRGGKTFTEAMKRAEEIVAEVEIGAKLKIDIDWYINQQLLPPITRLIEHIEGIEIDFVA